MQFGTTNLQKKLWEADLILALSRIQVHLKTKFNKFIKDG
jgi:hypothetical protein